MQPFTSKPFRPPPLFKQTATPALRIPEVGGGPSASSLALGPAAGQAAPGNTRSALVAALSSRTPDVSALAGILQQLHAKTPAPAGVPGRGGGAAPNGASTPGSIPHQQPSIQIQGNVTAQDRKAVALAQHFLGTPYSWGGGGPSGPTRGIAQGAHTVGFDCSGLIQFVWARQGVQVGGDTYSQWKQGKAVPLNKLRPGDAVFFDMGKGGPGHVGMYVGHGKFIESPHTGATVRISTLKGRGAVGARRYG